MVEDKGLLAEVAGLVEWPVVLMGDIAPDFLALPPEVLQTSMREHQKFFSVRNPKTGRIEKFITVANRETADDGATILAGNQKVLFARLSDAKFFWENDLRTVKAEGLEGMAKGLAQVTFHNKLGSAGRTGGPDRRAGARNRAACGRETRSGGRGGADRQGRSAVGNGRRIPRIAGPDGHVLRPAAGHDDGVPEACRDHYSPLGPNDAVPTAPVSVAVALADKIDTLTGFWAIDEKPTGSAKTRSRLRRAALGVIRLVLGNGVRFDFSLVISKAFERSHESAFGKTVVASIDSEGNLTNPRPHTLAENIHSDLLAFLHDRLKVHLKDQGIRHDVIDACLAMPGNDDLVLLVNRATRAGGFSENRGRHQPVAGL